MGRGTSEDVLHIEGEYQKRISGGGGKREF